jgi:hypothetical protein
VRHVIAALLISIVVLGMAETSLYAVVFSDSFDSYSVGIPPGGGWTERYSSYDGVERTREYAAAHGVAVQVDNFGLPTKSVHFLDSSTGFGSEGVSGQLMHTFSQMSSVVLDYDVLTVNDDYSGVIASLRGNKDSSQTSLYALIFSSGTDLGVKGWIGVYHSPSPWAEQKLLSYDVNTWYHVRESVNVSTDAIQFDVWEVDNPSNRATWATLDHAYTEDYIDKVEIWTGNSGGGNGYIDNVAISAPEPSTCALLGAGAAYLLAHFWRKRKLAQVRQ